MGRTLKYFLITALLTVYSAWATNIPGVNNVLNVGGASNSTAIPALTIPSPITVTATTLPIMLVGGIDTSLAARYYSFQKASGLTQGSYQVTAGKTFYVTGFWAKSSAATNLAICYGQNSVTFANAASSLTGTTIYFNSAGGNTAANCDTGGFLFPALSTLSEMWIPTPGLQFAGTYFPFFLTDTAATTISVRIVGYEQ